MISYANSSIRNVRLCSNEIVAGFDVAWARRAVAGIRDSFRDCFVRKCAVHRYRFEKIH